MSRPARATLFLVATAGALGAGCGAPIDLGPDPDLVWWSDFETCDATDWDVTWEAAGGQLSQVDTPVRSGRCAMRSQVVAQPAGTISGAQLIKPDGVPGDAYESAWFYVPAAIGAPGSVAYWVFFKLGSRTVADDASTGVDVWDFNLQPTDAGGLDVVIIPRIAGVASPPVLGNPAVPLGRWFQVEAHLRASPGADGVLQLWVDDTLLLDVRGPTTPTAAVGWSIGGGCDSLTSPAAIMDIDDAAVATRRLGPRFPAFTRAR